MGNNIHSKTSMENGKIDITLTRDEAIVLFEFLSRFSDNNELSIKHPAEVTVLWRLTGLFEKILSEPFRSDYLQLVAAARAALQERDE